MVNQDPVSMAVSGVVVVLLVDFLRAHQAWGWMRLVQGAAAFKDTPGLLFTKAFRASGPVNVAPIMACPPPPPVPPPRAAWSPETNWGGSTP